MPPLPGPVKGEKASRVWQPCRALRRFWRSGLTAVAGKQPGSPHP